MTAKLQEFLDKWKLKPECGAYVGDGWIPLLEGLMENSQNMDLNQNNVVR